MSRRVVRWCGVAACVSYALFCFATIAYADTLSSAHYKFSETDLGGGGLIPASSTNYQSVESAGDNAVGSSASTNFQFKAGSQTTKDPALAFAITNSSATFSTFSATSTATATAAFTVSDYTSYGYAVQIIGNPPSNNGHTITAMGTTTPASPSVGTEQFGINLVSNTSPISFGANPNLGQFGAGVAATNYNTTNKYRYVSGETIASAPKSSGVTTFTISYVVDVADITPGGRYTSNQTVICTGTY